MGGLLMIAAIVAIVYAFVVIAGRSGRTNAHLSNDELQNKAGSALRILSERYAKGEINDEEYQQKKNTLRNL